MKTIATCVAILLFFGLPAGADDNLARDSGSLKELRDKVRQSLPDGWRIEITPQVPSDVVSEVDFQHDRCRLLVWHEEKVLGKYVGPNGRAFSSEEEAEVEYQSVTPTIQLIVTKFFTPAEYQKAAEHNIACRRTRLDFEKQPLGPAVFMGAKPIPPSSYRPETAEQKELVRQYALLWTQTEGELLPTHFYQHLSLEMRPSHYLSLKDPQIEAERHDLETSILKLITAYPEVPQAVD